MEPWANNTLRTLGIIITSIIVIGGSLFLILLALCLGALGTQGGQFHNQSDQQAFYLSIFVIIALISFGVFIVARLAKGIIRETPEYPFLLATSPTIPGLSTTGLPSAPLPAQPSPAAAPRAIDVTTHFSPASRTAIRQLALAIAAKLVAETLVTVIGWTYTYQARQAVFPVFRYSFIAWGLGAAAPLLVLLYALLRCPGPRAFAYSLVIPSLHIFFGLFGHSAAIFMLFRHTSGVPPALSLFALGPWLLDILILYLALKAIRLTGIRPNSIRLIVASAVIFFYTLVLPVFIFAMNSILRT